MTSYESNVFYHPERHALETVAEIDTGGGYDFEKFVVWRHTVTGALYWAADAGCSCPTPFEDFASIAELETGDAKRCEEAAHRWMDGLYSSSAEDRAELHRLIAKVREVVR